VIWRTIRQGLEYVIGLLDMWQNTNRKYFGTDELELHCDKVTLWQSLFRSTKKVDSKQAETDQKPHRYFVIYLRFWLWYHYTQYTELTLYIFPVLKILRRFRICMLDDNYTFQVIFTKRLKMQNQWPWLTWKHGSESILIFYPHINKNHKRDLFLQILFNSEMHFSNLLKCLAMFLKFWRL